MDAATVHSLCGEAPMLETAKEGCSMGVDTGRALHVVILQEDEHDCNRQHLVRLEVDHEFSDLDDLMKRYHVNRCVIDGLPETHATRKFAERNGSVYLCFFREDQKGGVKWSHRENKVEVNRTEALDPSRDAVRERRLVLPRRDRLVETFAKHMAADAKKLEEDEETGAQKYRYIKTGENHFSFAFTYAWMAAAEVIRFSRYLRMMFGSD